MEKDLYAVLGVSKTAPKAEIKAAFKRGALKYHSDRNRDEAASAKFAEISEAYAILSNPAKRTLYDALGPEKYDDPREVFRYQQEREAAVRDMRDYEAYRSAHREEVAKTTGTLVFFLVLMNLIPSWVLGPWFIIFNAFLLLSLAISVYQWFDV